MSPYAVSERYDFKISADPLKQLVRQNWYPEFPFAKFPLYTLCDLSKSSMEEILAEVDKEVLGIFPGSDENEEEFDECYRVLELPAEWKFPGQSLQSLLQHHFKRLSSAKPIVDETRAWNFVLRVYPIGLILATKEDWRDRGLLFVYLDRDNDERESENLLVKTATVNTEGQESGLAGALTSLRLGDEYFDQIRASYERIPVERSA